MLFNNRLKSLNLRVPISIFDLAKWSTMKDVKEMPKDFVTLMRTMLICRSCSHIRSCWRCPICNLWGWRGHICSLWLGLIGHLWFGLIGNLWFDNRGRFIYYGFRSANGNSSSLLSLDSFLSSKKRFYCKNFSRYKSLYHKSFFYSKSNFYRKNVSATTAPYAQTRQSKSS